MSFIVHVNTHMKKYIIASIGFICLFLVFPGSVFADSFVLNLFNDGEQVRFDRFVDKIELDSGRDVILNLQNRVEEDTEYQAGLVSSNKNLPPIKINLEIQEGVFSELVPYYEHIQSIQLLRNGEIIDEVDVSQYTLCNSNGICEIENGENENTCLFDCVRSQVEFSPETQQRLDQEGGVIRDSVGDVLIDTTNTGGNSNTVIGEESPPSSNDIFSWRIVLGGIFVIGGMSYGIYRLVKKII
jgi:hypothetical protein